MSKDLVHFFIIGGIFLVLFVVGEVLFHYFKVKGEYTRKFIHAVTGIITLLFPVFFESHWYVLILCSMFAIILQVSIRMDFLKSINTIDRHSYGSVAYPVAVYGTFLFARYTYSGFEPSFYYVPILTLAICDPIAAIVGKNFPWKPFKVGNDTKTIAGTSAFFVSATLLIFFLLAALTDSPKTGTLIMTFVIALFTTIAEALSRKGLDNIFVPATAVALLYFFSHYTQYFSRFD